MTFPDSFLLLQQEGYLIRTSLGQGLTLLRSADLGEKGHYYGAFFGLSIGLERMLKVIVILDHMSRNQLAPPSGAVLRKLGHDLQGLLTAVRGIPSRQSPHPMDRIRPGSIEQDIVDHLGQFAEACGRYANLDALTSGRVQADPLGNWKRILERILEEDVPGRAKDKARIGGKALAAAMSGSAKVIAHDLGKQPLSLEEWFVIPRMHELAAPKAIARTFGILRPVKSLLEEVNDLVTAETHRQRHATPVVPFMYEFFDFISDHPSVLHKKRWP